MLKVRYDRPVDHPDGPCLAQDASSHVLDAYAHHGTEERVNSPDDESDWLKKKTLHDGELDDFPEAAIVPASVDVGKISQGAWLRCFYKSGFPTASPIRPDLSRSKPGTVPFAVARGLPGAGGITTQVAEATRHGRESIIHVGTCGLLSPDVPYGQVIRLRRFLPRRRAFLLTRMRRPRSPDRRRADGSKSPSRRPNESCRWRTRSAFTMPIYYFQPGSILPGSAGDLRTRKAGVCRNGGSAVLRHRGPDGNPGRQHRRSLRPPRSRGATASWPSASERRSRHPRTGCVRTPLHALTDKAP